MSKKNCNLNKISRMSEEAFLNALRLHYDSIVLYRNRSFASAYFLSVLALEELGKVSLLEDFVWHSVMRWDGRMATSEEEEFLGKMFKHQHKQILFAREFEEILPSKVLKSIRDGRMDINKQNAAYVGLDRKKGKVNLKGRIITPFSLQRAKVKEQITVVNDYLIVLNLGVINGVLCVEGEGIESQLDSSLLSWLNRTWRTRSHRTRRMIGELKKAK